MKELCLALTGRVSRLGGLLRVILPQQPGELLQLRIRIKCNVQHALAVKAIFLLLGAFGIANMWWAVFADVGVMILAVLNAMRMLIVEKN